MSRGQNKIIKTLVILESFDVKHLYFHCIKVYEQKNLKVISKILPTLSPSSWRQCSQWGFNLLYVASRLDKEFDLAFPFALCSDIVRCGLLP